MINPKHRQEWLSCGVSQQIIDQNVWTVEDSAEVDQLLNRNDRARWKHSHQLVPGWAVRGVDPRTGEPTLLGAQFKPDSPQIGANGKPQKYLSVSGYAAEPLFLDTGEPGYWPQVLKNPSNPVLITEGGKKAGSALARGFACISIPGVGCGQKMGQLRDRLKLFCGLGRKVYLAFDSDQLTNPNVCRELQRLGRLIAAEGASVYVLQWGSEWKGLDDYLVASPIHSIEKLIKNALTFDEWRKNRIDDGYRLTYPPNIELNQRYLGDIYIPDHARLIAARSPKGTGKTQTIAGWVEQAYLRGQPVLVLTYREQLGGQLAQRFRLLYKTEVPGHREEARLYGYALCVDSMHPGAAVPFRWEDWQDALVIIDEAESVIWHTLNSDTCADRRVAILNQIRNLLRAVLSPEGSGQVMLSDADLSDHSVDFIKGMAGQASLKPFTIVNHWKPEQGWQVYNYQTPASLYSKMMESLPDGKHLILTTGQRADSRWGTQTLEKAIRKRYPGKSILRIDSETISDPSHPAFGCLAGDINALLAGYDVVIASPTLESGVSLDLYGHFAGVWGWLTGAVSENSARQFLARLRDGNVPRHIFVAERAINSAFTGSGEVSPKALLESQHRLARVNASKLREWGISIDEDGSVSYSPAALETFGRMGARINRGLHSYRLSVLAGLKAEGHQIIDVESLDRQADKEISEEVGAVRDANHDQQCQAIAAATPATEENYQKLKRKRAKTESERNSQRHYELKQRYSVPVSADLVKRDDAGWYSQIRLQYFLTVGADHLKARELKRLQEIAPDRTGWIPDLNRRSLATKIEVLKFLGIDRLLSLAMAGETFTGSHPLVEEIAGKALRFAIGIKEALGLRVTEASTPMSVVQNILNHCFGFRLTSRQVRLNGQRAWLYRWQNPSDGREQVFNAWLEKDIRESEKYEIYGSLPVIANALNN